MTGGGLFVWFGFGVRPTRLISSASKSGDSPPAAYVPLCFPKARPHEANPRRQKPQLADKKSPLDCRRAARTASLNRNDDDSRKRRRGRPRPDVWHGRQGDDRLRRERVDVRGRRPAGRQDCRRRRRGADRRRRARQLFRHERATTSGSPSSTASASPARTCATSAWRWRASAAPRWSKPSSPPSNTDRGSASLESWIECPRAFDGAGL